MNRRSTTGFRKRKLFVFAVAVLSLALLAWYVNTHLSIAQLALRESELRDYITRHPMGAFLIGFAVYTTLALIPGTPGKAIVSGWLFGFWLAFIIVNIGLTAGAMTIFWLSRYLIRETIERRFANFLALMNRHIEKEGAFYLLTLRLAHVPYSLVNPVSGASRITAWTFFWTSVVGLLPLNIIWIYVGIRLPSLNELVEYGTGAFIDTPLIVALAGCALLPLLLRRLLRFFRSDATSDYERRDSKAKTNPEKF